MPSDPGRRLDGNSPIIALATWLVAPQNARVAMKTPTWIPRASLFFGASALVLSLGACTQPKSNSSATGSSSAAASTAGPKIEVEEPVHDFGTVTAGEKVTHTFTVENAGTAPLLIKRVRSSCGCTAAVTKKKELPPGGSTEIEVTFNTRGRVGPNRKTVTIQTNDEQTPNKKLQIKAMIERLLAFKPTIVRLNVEHDEEKSVEAWLTGKLAKDAKLVLGDVTGDTGVKVELTEKKDGEETKHGLRFTLEGKEVGRGNGTVTVETGVEKVPKLTLRFNTVVRGNLQLRPRALYFDNRSPRGKERVLRVTSKRDDFKIVTVKVIEGPYEAEYSKPETGAGYRVNVKLVETAEDAKGDDGKKPNLNGKLEIRSNDPLQKKVEIPLHVRRLPNLRRPRPGLPIRRGPKGRPTAPKLPNKKPVK